MLEDKSQAGFTLIEIMIVMSLAGLFGMIIFFGQGQIRQRAQFSDAMERIKNDIIRVKNETDTSVNITATGTPDARVTFWGKRIRFNATDLTIDTLIYVEAGGPVPAGASCIGAFPGVCTLTTDTSVQPLQWGIQLDPLSANQEIIFRRNPTTAQLETFSADTSFAYQDPSAYILNGGAPVQLPILVKYLDPNNALLKAYIAVDPPSQTIKLVYQ